MGCDEESRGETLGSLNFHALSCECVPLLVSTNDEKAISGCNQDTALASADMLLAAVYLAFRKCSGPAVDICAGRIVRQTVPFSSDLTFVQPSWATNPFTSDTT